MSTLPLAYSVDGPEHGPTLVLSSSLGTTGEMWLPQVDRLSERWRVVRFDHPGHGDSPTWDSPTWDSPFTVGDIGRGVIELLDGLGSRRVPFCGLSLGGAVGQWLAAHAPERIDRLVLCSTSAFFGATTVYRERAALVRREGVAPVAGAVVQRWFTPQFHSTYPEVVHIYRSMLESISPEGYASCCEAVAAFDGRGDLAAIAAPTLVIAGAEDPATPVPQGRALVEGIEGARLQIIPDAAHLANVEQPELVGNAIVEHLSEGIDA
jgi:3-oxoadipate enol-lactonase